MQFEELYNKYYNSVLKYFSKRISEIQDVEDLVLQVFINCYEKFDTYDSSKASVGTWIYAITRHCYINYLRGKKINYESIDPNEDDIRFSDDTDMDFAVELSEMRKLVAEALSTLDEEKQRIIVMRYFYNKPEKEIAEITGKSHANVRVIINRAIKKMREHLISKGITWDFD